jgi:hypothetical protein
MKITAEYKRLIEYKKHKLRWNGKDPILKERMFGLSGSEGNHGEDGKEYYFYLDSTPTHSYMKMLYKYPQAEFPYAKLVAENKQRGLSDFEYELADTGAFKENPCSDRSKIRQALPSLKQTIRQQANIIFTLKTPRTFFLRKMKPIKPGFTESPTTILTSRTHFTAI